MAVASICGTDDLGGGSVAVTRAEEIGPESVAGRRMRSEIILEWE